MSDRPKWKLYGRGWSEPLAVGRWARFCQRMREPMTKHDVLLAFGLIPPVFMLAVVLLF